MKNSENKLTTATTICLNQRKETNVLRNAFMDLCRRVPERRAKIQNFWNFMKIQVPRIHSISVGFNGLQ